MNSARCKSCGMIGFANALKCKGCGAVFIGKKRVKIDIMNRLLLKKELEDLVRSSVEGGELTDVEMNAIYDLYERSGFTEIEFLTIKDKVFKWYVRINLNHPKVSDRRLKRLSIIAQKLGLIVGDIYEYADVSPRCINIFATNRNRHRKSFPR